MILAYSFAQVPVVPVRSEPNHRSEQVTQLLFGEKAEIYEINGKDWAKIRTAFDDYPGWCRASQLKLINKREFHKSTKHTVATHTGKLLGNKGEMLIPAGSELTGLKKRKIAFLNDDGVFKGKKVLKKNLGLNPELIKVNALKFLYAPYQWGGRTISGIDCSGFTQIAYKLCNFQLPRDASQQAAIGSLVEFLPAAQTGDLAFFDDKDGKIVHVGILLDQETIVHASDSSGCVMIDKIDQGGIVSITQKKRTHNLRLIKRMLP